MREEIKAILDSDLTSTEISKRTGIIRQSVDNYRNNNAQLDNMTLKNAEKLSELYKEQIKMKEPLVLENLMATHYGNGVHTLEFDVDGQKVFVNYELGPVDDELYWDDEKHIKEAVENGNIEYK